MLPETEQTDVPERVNPDRIVEEMSDAIKRLRSLAAQLHIVAEQEKRILAN